ncbi:MAG: hypothetical protein Q7J64_04200 [Elusimicrobiota bacterium]|nr:hypothetical protein [Elusimicrobiota bacterium]
MKQLSAVLTVILAMSLAGCGLMKATGVMKDPPPNTVVSLDVSGAKSFRDSDTLVVPTAYLRLTVDGKAAAVSDSNAFSTDTSNARVTLKYKINGVDKALAQEISKAAYEDFVAKLRAAGYKVLTYDDIKDQISDLTRYSKDEAYDLPVDAGQLVVTPTDEMAIKPGMGGNIVAPYQRFGKSKLKEGTLIIPTFTITSPLAKAETSGSTANLQLFPSMALTAGSVAFMTHGGGWGSAKLKKVVFGLSENVGTIVKTADTSPSVANALTKTFAILGGVGGTNRKSAAYTMTVDRAAYRDAAVKGLTQFNDELAKVAADAKKS